MSVNVNLTGLAVKRPVLAGVSAIAQVMMPPPRAGKTTTSQAMINLDHANMAAMNLDMTIIEILTPTAEEGVLADLVPEGTNRADQITVSPTPNTLGGTDQSPDLVLIPQKQKCKEYNKTTTGLWESQGMHLLMKSRKRTGSSPCLIILTRTLTTRVRYRAFKRSGRPMKS
jgi:hypothetical protein